MGEAAFSVEYSSRSICAGELKETIDQYVLRSEQSLSGGGSDQESGG